MQRFYIREVKGYEAHLEFELHSQNEIVSIKVKPCDYYIWENEYCVFINENTVCLLDTSKEEKIEEAIEILYEIQDFDEDCQFYSERIDILQKKLKEVRRNLQILEDTATTVEVISREKR